VSARAIERAIGRLLASRGAAVESVDVLRADLVASRGDPSVAIRRGSNEGYVVTCGVRGQEALRLRVLGSESEAFDAARIAYRMLAGTPRTWARAHGGR